MPKKAGGATAPVAQPAPGGFDQFQNPIAPGFQAPAAAVAPGQVRPLPQPAGAMVAAPAPAAAAATSANAAVEAARLKAQAAQQAGGGGGKKFESNPVGEQRGRVRNFVADLDEQLTCEDGTSTMLYKLCHLSALFCGCLVPFGAWWHPSVFDAVNNRDPMLGGMIVGTFLLCFVLTPLILRETRRTSSRLEEDTDPDLSRPCCLPSRNLRPWETFVNSQGETEIIQNPAGYLPRMGAGFAMLFEKQADVLSFNYNAFHPMLFQKPRVSNFFMTKHLGMIIFWGGISAFIAITGKGVEPSELHNRISVAPFFFYMILALPVAVAWNLTIGFATALVDADVQAIMIELDKEIEAQQIDMEQAKGSEAGGNILQSRQRELQASTSTTGGVDFQTMQTHKQRLESRKHVHLTDQQWDVLIATPCRALVFNLQLLSEGWGRGVEIWSAFSLVLAFTLLCLFLSPTVTTFDEEFFQGMSVIVRSVCFVLIFLSLNIPLCILRAPARLTTDCAALKENLNQLRCNAIDIRIDQRTRDREAQSAAAGRGGGGGGRSISIDGPHIDARVAMLERMLSNVNRGQGMGFMVLGTNITTFTLQKFQKGLQALFVMVAPFLLSASASILAKAGPDFEDSSPMCRPSEQQVAIVRAAFAAVEECSWNQTLEDFLGD